MRGQTLLRQLGALDGGAALNAHGRALARLGLHPRLGHLLLRAARLGCPELGCELAVLLSERDPLDPRQAGCDLIRRLDWLRQGDVIPSGGNCWSCNGNCGASWIRPSLPRRQTPAAPKPSSARRPRSAPSWWPGPTRSGWRSPAGRAPTAT
ncbi:hypothetical protein [Cyanobium sp. ATX-6F1]|uniref:hypothetical protein n=1 Tax=Cyanobium sp. ATX-6F1 TaxID=3137388 RepID=UPI0039BDD981